MSIRQKIWAGEFSVRTSENYTHLSDRMPQNKLMSNPAFKETHFTHQMNALYLHKITLVTEGMKVLSHPFLPALILPWHPFVIFGSETLGMSTAITGSFLGKALHLPSLYQGHGLAPTKHTDYAKHLKRLTP